MKDFTDECFLREAFYRNRFFLGKDCGKFLLIKTGVTDSKYTQTVTPDGIRSRLRSGIGYAMTLGNFREGDVPGAKRNFRITRRGDQYALLIELRKERAVSGGGEVQKERHATGSRHAAESQ